MSETRDGITWTTKDETMAIHAARYKESYRLRLEKLAGTDGARDLAQTWADAEIHKPECKTNLAGICMDYAAYIVTNATEVKKKNWWIGLSFGSHLFEHAGKTYIATPECPYCSAYGDAFKAGQGGLSMDNLLNRVNHATATDDERAKMRELIKRAHARGVKKTEEYKQQHGTERYTPKRRKANAPKSAAAISGAGQ